MTERIRRVDYQAMPNDPCISLYCFHAREYHAPNCVFSGCTCKAFKEAPTEAEAEAILREQGIDAKQLTNDFIEHLFKHITKQAAELSTVTKLGRILCERLRFVHDDPKYRGVWATAQLHQGPYDGPTYTDELVAFESSLRAKSERSSSV